MCLERKIHLRRCRTAIDKPCKQVQKKIIENERVIPQSTTSKENSEQKTGKESIGIHLNFSVNGRRGT